MNSYWIQLIFYKKAEQTIAHEGFLWQNKEGCNMTFEKWLDTFIDEKELDRNYVFEIEYEDTTHLMKFKALTESIIALLEKHRKKLRTSSLQSISGTVTLWTF